MPAVNATPLIEILSRDEASSAAPWLRDLRQNGQRIATERGIPTPREESWRYTNLRTLAKTSFVAGRDHNAAVSIEQLDELRIADLDATRLIFVNGRFDAEQSDNFEAAQGIVVCPMSVALEQHEELVRQHLGSLTPLDEDAFIAMNTASLEEGLFVHVPNNTVLERPVYMLHLTSADETPLVTHPRILIVVGKGAKATVIEDYAGLGDGVYLTNALTEIIVGAEGDLEHYRLERESDAAFSMLNLDIHQGEKSNFRSHSILLGGRLVRNNVRPMLDGEFIESTLNGVYIGNDDQHIDNQMRVIHAMPNGDSRQYYRGILGGKAKGIFCGRIVVDKDAQKTDAVQSNANLLLSGTAQAASMPQLEIYADDVKCTHGATIGELDDEAIFYLQARGIPRERAKAMMVYAFAAEGLERMDLDCMHDAVAEMILARIPRCD